MIQQDIIITDHTIQTMITIPTLAEDGLAETISNETPAISSTTSLHFAIKLSAYALEQPRLPTTKSEEETSIKSSF
jgi:hypothetical protein